MKDSQDITAHYSLGGLRGRIESGLERLAERGIEPTVESLAAVDEFHIGGRPATKYLLEQLQLGPADHVLDLGSGLGGTARMIASSTGAAVTGIDLTAEYVEVATWLTELVGLDDLIDSVVGSATELDWPAGTFTAATMVHVGMNIADKARLCRQVAVVLAPGSPFAIYDVMAGGADTAAELNYPVPWAGSAATSKLGGPREYEQCLDAAGFGSITVEDRTSAALAAFDQLASQAGGGPPPLGLHLVMGPEFSTKVANMVAGVRSGLIAPTLVTARLGPASDAATNFGS